MVNRWRSALLFLAAATLLPFPPRGLAIAADDLNALSRLSASFETIADRVRPAVVEILASGYTVPEDEGARGASLLAMRRAVGSGVIVDPHGYIVTNALGATAPSLLE